MAFAKGAATFNSCNKAGAILHFNKYLEANPGDYNALMWRSSAHFITGQRQDGLRDLDRAIAVSSGANKQLAIIKRSINDGSATRASAVERYKKVIQQYPDAWKGWNGIGDILVQDKRNKEALGYYKEALAIATRTNELSDPGICWLKKNMGDIYQESGDLNQAKASYESAIESCPSHTVSHISLCKVNILQGNEHVARDYFRRAKELNPVLIGESSFEEYKRMVEQSSAGAGGSSGGSGGGGGDDGK